ncbi:MAG: hypothetical protein ACK4FM_04240 [Caldimicrobium sp.]
MAHEKIISMDKRSPSHQEALSPLDDMILKVTKEIVIKFIEMGRCSPATFEEVFTLVHSVIKKTVHK